MEAGAHFPDELCPLWGISFPGPAELLVVERCGQKAPVSLDSGGKGVNQLLCFPLLESLGYWEALTVANRALGSTLERSFDMIAVLSQAGSDGIRGFLAPKNFG